MDLSQSRTRLAAGHGSVSSRPANEILSAGMPSQRAHRPQSRFSHSPALPVDEDLEALQEQEVIRNLLELRLRLRRREALGVAGLMALEEECMKLLEGPEDSTSGPFRDSKPLLQQRPVGEVAIDLPMQKLLDERQVDSKSRPASEAETLVQQRVIDKVAKQKLLEKQQVESKSRPSRDPEPPIQQRHFDEKLLGRQVEGISKSLPDTEPVVRYGFDEATAELMRRKLLDERPVESRSRPFHEGEPLIHWRVGDWAALEKARRKLLQTSARAEPLHHRSVGERMVAFEEEKTRRLLETSARPEPDVHRGASDRMTGLEVKLVGQTDCSWRQLQETETLVQRREVDETAKQKWTLPHVAGPGAIKEMHQPLEVRLQSWLVHGVEAVEVKILDKWQQPLSWYRALLLLKDLSTEGQFLRDLLTKTMAECNFEAFYWECCPVTTGSVFEFVLLDAPALLLRRPSPEAFGSRLYGLRGQPVVTDFLNLGSDAVLLAPAPVSSRTFNGYEHLAAFVRSQEVPAEQKDALWKKLGQVVLRELDTCPEPLWIGTDGRGVHWLHLRLDTSPKYTKWPPYKRVPVPLKDYMEVLNHEEGLRNVTPDQEDLGISDNALAIKSVSAQGSIECRSPQPPRSTVGRSTAAGSWAVSTLGITPGSLLVHSKASQQGRATPVHSCQRPSSAARPGWK